jgi:hypothetical protein
MGVKLDFFKQGSFIIGDRESTRFWEDSWLGATPFSTHYPSLYSIVGHINVTIANVLLHSPLNIGYRRTLSEKK